MCIDIKTINVHLTSILLREIRENIDSCRFSRSIIAKKRKKISLLDREIATSEHKIISITFLKIRDHNNILSHKVDDKYITTMSERSYQKNTESKVFLYCIFTFLSFSIQYYPLFISIMIDLKILRTQSELIRESIQKRNLSLDLDALIALDNERLQLQRDLE